MTKGNTGTRSQSTQGRRCLRVRPDTKTWTPRHPFTEKRVRTLNWVGDRLQPVRWSTYGGTGRTFVGSLTTDTGGTRPDLVWPARDLDYGGSRVSPTFPTLPERPFETGFGRRSGRGSRLICNLYPSPHRSFPPSHTRHSSYRPTPWPRDKTRGCGTG